MRESGLAIGELLRPEGLRRGSVPGRLAVLLELLGQGEVRVVRVSLRLHRLLVGLDSAITVGIPDI